MDGLGIAVSAALVSTMVTVAFEETNNRANLDQAQRAVSWYCVECHSKATKTIRPVSA